MKNYTITVNGNVYDVTVEENGAVGIPAKPKAAPVKELVKEVTAAKTEGSVKIEAGAAGKVFKIVASVGQEVKRGDAVIILESMKMEIPMVAPEEGVVTSIDVVMGDTVEAGKVIATLN